MYIYICVCVYIKRSLCLGSSLSFVVSGLAWGRLQIHEVLLRKAGSAIPDPCHTQTCQRPVLLQECLELINEGLPRPKRVLTESSAPCIISYHLVTDSPPVESFPHGLPLTSMNARHLHGI